MLNPAQFVIYSLWEMLNTPQSVACKSWKMLNPPRPVVYTLLEMLNPAQSVRFIKPRNLQTFNQTAKNPTHITSNLKC